MRQHLRALIAAYTVIALAALLLLTGCGGGDIEDDPIDEAKTCTPQECSNPR